MWPIHLIQITFHHLMSSICRLCHNNGSDVATSYKGWWNMKNTRGSEENPGSRSLQSVTCHIYRTSGVHNTVLGSFAQALLSVAHIHFKSQGGRSFHSVALPKAWDQQVLWTLNAAQNLQVKSLIWIVSYSVSLFIFYLTYFFYLFFLYFLYFFFYFWSQSICDRS